MVVDSGTANPFCVVTGALVDAPIDRAVNDDVLSTYTHSR
jgi:hypothetical protein